MSNELAHHGIKGMKWGVRRTPAQLGHLIKSKMKRPPADSAKKPPTAKKSRPPKKLSELTDDELRQRISRLNMEEQYANLVARQKERDTGVVKKMLVKAAENLGEKALGVAVDKVVDKISNKRFNINDWKGVDIDNIDADMIPKVAAWYKAAESIKKGRNDLNGNSSGSENGKKKKEDSSSKKVDSKDGNKSGSAPSSENKSESASPQKPKRKDTWYNFVWS